LVFKNAGITGYHNKTFLRLAAFYTQNFFPRSRLPRIAAKTPYTLSGMQNNTRVFQHLNGGMKVSV
jgi:hypothetical protein